MVTESDVIELLKEIRDNQNKSYEAQLEMVSYYKQQIESSQKKSDESIELQKIAVKRQKDIQKVTIPIIIICIFILLYVFTIV